MELHSLKPARGAVKTNTRRKGRGQGSGRGGTATRGHKGQKSRSGYSRKRHHEGGQMPLQMRVPKIGFKSPNRVEYVGLNLDQLQALINKHGLKEVTLDGLKAIRCIRKRDRLKIMGRGEIESAVVIEAHAFTASARQAIEAKGGSVSIVQ